MKMKLLVGALCAVVLLPAHAVAASTASEPTPPQPDLSIASYGDQKIDLRESWGTAKACLATDSETICFASEREMDKYVSRLSLQASVDVASGGVGILSACTSSVKLYSSTSWGGTLLEIWDRLVVIGLSTYGFDNVTSSYKIGACAAYFWDGVGSGSVYPGNTNANVWSSSMSAGWDNRVSSVALG